jgi:HD-GYP domain-containing protein (c-di-GMP phosphodiesterase class II)
LKGEQIPLAARVFAVVDVWDALRSDRPYRKARPREMVYAYIREQSGKHFDPRVVEAFLDISERAITTGQRTLFLDTAPLRPTYIEPAYVNGSSTGNGLSGPPGNGVHRN